MSASGREATLCRGLWRFKSALSALEYLSETIGYDQLRNRQRFFVNYETGPDAP